MKSILNSLQALSAVAVVAALSSLPGCGGGGDSSSKVGGGGGGGSVAANVTARFHVDVKSGQVTISPSGSVSGAAQSRSIFAGTAVGFNSSVLLDQPSTIGLKTLSVSVVNNWALPIGQAPDGSVNGLKVLFGSFVNVTGFSDLRPRTTVSTVAGTGSVGSTNGPVAGASFNLPSGIAATGNGVLYVTDKAGNVIRKIANGSVSTLAGSGAAGGVDGQGTAARFNFPFGIAVNPVDGALIVTDLLGNLVRRVTIDGRVTTIAGNGAASSVNGAGNTSTINGPAGVAIDSTGAIYVGEYFGQHVRKIVLTGGNPAQAASYLVSTLAGSTAGNTDGVGANAKFSQPVGLAVAPDGTTYVADQGNNSIRRISPAGEVATIAGTGAAASVDGTGDTAQFNSPRGIVFVNGALIVADRLGNLLRQLTLTTGASPSTANSWNVASLAGTGSAGTTDGSGDVATISQPQLIAADPSGNLLVPDSNSDIRQIVPANGYFPIGAPNGVAANAPVQLSNADGVVPSQGAGANLPFIQYAGVIGSGAMSAAQNWNFTVPSAVSAFEFTVTVEADTTALAPPEGASGVGSARVSVRTFSGTAQIGGYIDGSLVAARFNGPEFLTFDAAGDMYIADNFNSLIRRISAGGLVTTVAGALSSGFMDGDGTVARFSSPAGIAVSPDGKVVYVADASNQRIRRISLNPGSDLTNPVNWTVSTIAGTASVGGNYISSQKGSVATFNSPRGLALDSGGNLYVTERFGNRLRRVVFGGGDPSQAVNWTVSLVAGSPLSISPPSGDADGTGISVRFNSPNQIAVDQAGNVYVADTNNERIRVVTGDAVVTTLAGGVSGDVPVSSYVDGFGSSAHFQDPAGISVDSSGLVYVSETSGNRIRCVAQNGAVTTLAGTGLAGNLNGSGAIATFFNPASIAVNSAGTLFVGSVNDNSIRILERIIGTGTR